MDSLLLMLVAVIFSIINDSLICYGDTISLIANSVDSGFAPITYGWFPFDSVMPDSTVTLVAPVDSMSYIFKVTIV